MHGARQGRWERIERVAEARPWTNKRTGTVQVPRGIDPGFEHNVGKVDSVRDGFRRLAPKLAVSAGVAREAVRGYVSGPWLERAFAGGRDLRGMPVAVIPGDIARALPERYRGSGLIVHGIAPRKLASRHPEVGPDEIRRLQRALDRGEVLLETRARRQRPSLVVHAPRAAGEGDPRNWWTWAIKLDDSPGANPVLATIFGKSETGRAAKLGNPRVTVLRAWDAERWSGG